MTSNHKPQQAINPNMVVLARESRGLSQQALADALHVPQSRVSMIEMGLRPVTDDLLEQLVELLDYPPHFFTQEGSLYGIGLAEVFHRKRQNVPKYTLERIYALMEIQLRQIAMLLRSFEVSYTIPQMNIDDYGEQIEEIARAVRAALQLPRGPIDDLTQTLEEAGVIIAALDFETPLVDAISRWVPKLPPLFFVNKRSPKDRYRYSLAHELGHTVMHTVPNPEMEDQANRFAAELLMPEREIRYALEDLSLAKLVTLKRYWKVSMAALLKRAQDLGTITPNRARYLWMQMSKAGYRTREPVELDVAGERPLFLRELVHRYLTQLNYTDDDLRMLLPLNEAELRARYIDEDSEPRLKVVR